MALVIVQSGANDLYAGFLSPFRLSSPVPSINNDNKTMDCRYVCRSSPLQILPSSHSQFGSETVSGLPTMFIMVFPVGFEPTTDRL